MSLPLISGGERSITRCVWSAVKSVLQVARALSLTRNGGNELLSEVKNSYLGALQTTFYEILRAFLSCCETRFRVKNFLVWTPFDLFLNTFTFLPKTWPKTQSTRLSHICIPHLSWILHESLIIAIFFVSFFGIISLAFCFFFLIFLLKTNKIRRKTTKIPKN